jgi:cytochrome c oxidase subunit 3
MSIEIGTGEIAEEFVELKVRKGSRISGRSSSGGSRNNGGGDGPDDENTRGTDESSFKKYKILTWFLLMVVVMTFGGLVAAYVVIATNKVPEWHPPTLPLQLWFSTFVIIASSFTYYLAERSLVKEQQSNARKWFISTTVLGVIFVVSQVIAWMDLMQQGLFVRGNPYLAFFYILTAVHAFHVAGGITALSAILLRSWYQTADPVKIMNRRNLAQVVGWYWHFMGGLWIAIFLLLQFWK